MWECGLKQYGEELNHVAHEVTPRVGVWIETNFSFNTHCTLKVTPRVGVWIET